MSRQLAAVDEFLAKASTCAQLPSGPGPSAAGGHGWDGSCWRWAWTGRSAEQRIAGAFVSMTPEWGDGGAQVEVGALAWDLRRRGGRWSRVLYSAFFDEEKIAAFPTEDVTWMAKLLGEAWRQANEHVAAMQTAVPERKGPRRTGAPSR